MADRILIVGDDREVAAVLERNLGAEGYETAQLEPGAHVVESAVQLATDLVVLDVTVPGHDAGDAARLLRADPRTAGVSILMVTSPALHKDRVAGLHAGADAYVDQPVDRAELVAIVDATLRRAKQLRGVSPLTGLPGNAEIEMRLDALLAAGRPFALLHTDLDSFKAYNDHYGFLRGDAAIVHTGRLLVDAVAEVDSPTFVGHIGGDDFAVLCAPEDAMALAAAIADAFEGSVARLYDPEDAARGGIEVADRQGTVRRFPLLSISIGIASTSVRPISSAGEAASIATEMKTVAKGTAGSSWALDRRHSA